MAFKQYNANDVTILVNGKRISGFGDADLVSFAEKTDRVTTMIDANGNGVNSINNQQGGDITLNLSMLSDANVDFSRLLNSNQYFSVTVSHGNERVSSQNAMFTKSPSGSYGKTANTRVWVITCQDYKYDFS